MLNSSKRRKKGELPDKIRLRRSVDGDELKESTPASDCVEECLLYKWSWILTICLVATKAGDRLRRRCREQVLDIWQSKSLGYH